MICANETCTRPAAPRRGGYNSGRAGTSSGGGRDPVYCSTVCRRAARGDGRVRIAVRPRAVVWHRLDELAAADGFESVEDMAEQLLIEALIDRLGDGALL